MNIDAIEFLPPASAVSATAGLNKVPGGGDFNIWLKEQVAEVNRQIIDSDQQLRQLALGEAENLHQVMIALEKAKLSFELTVQVRNKLLEAYQDIMRMQI